MNKQMYLFKRRYGDILLMLPAISLFLFIVVIPFSRGIGIAFTNWDGFSPDPSFTGLRNFRILLTDSALLRPLYNTLYFALATVVLVNISGLLLAFGVHQNFRGVGILKTLFFMPIVISLVLASIIWSYIFSDVMTRLTGANGLLGSSSTVMFGLTIICLWRDSGLAMLTYLAALKTIPAELYESAVVDGASGLRKLFSITLPMIAPATTINITLWLGWGLKVFDYPMAATGGGPGSSSWTLAIYVYKYAFSYGKAGYGQAAAVFLFIIVVTITLTVTRLLRKRETEL